MLFSLSKQIAHCHRRAAECRELAARYASAIDREYYFEREQAWLKLARSYESRRRLDRRLTELELSVGCFSVRIACAVLTALHLPSRIADLPIIPNIPITPPQDPAALGFGLGTRRHS
jgi:hypothetical protein